MATTSLIPDALYDKVIEYLANTPHALGAILLSSFSGYIWVYIIIAYFNSDAKGEKIIATKTGKLALGLMWYSLIMLPVYLITNFTFMIEYEKVMEAIIPTLLYGSFFQAIIFILISWKKG